MEHVIGAKMRYFDNRESVGLVNSVALNLSVLNKLLHQESKVCELK